VALHFHSVPMPTIDFIIVFPLTPPLTVEDGPEEFAPHP